MGLLFNILFGTGKKANRKNSDAKFERKMEQYGLFNDEKKLVRSRQYDSWNFEEEELDEDDYYYDD